MPTVNNAEIINFMMRDVFKIPLISIPIVAENKLIIIKNISVFKKPKFARFLFISIDIFITAEITDIKKYPIIREYVPKYFGKNTMQKMRTAEDIT